MTQFQLGAIAVLGVLLVVTIVTASRRRMSPPAALGWSVLWITASALIAAPDLTMALARVLGIGRGADLVFYAAILGGLVALFLIYVRFRRVERQFTVIVRQLAMLEEEVRATRFVSGRSRAVAEEAEGPQNQVGRQEK